jgi:peptidoglycan/xylan/chitin deacetylase (PgdA/CDA1 family)
VTGPPVPAAQAAPAIEGKALGGQAAASAKVPILMYHAISIPPAGAASPELFVTTRDFTDQMQALRDQGYQPVSLDQLWAAWHKGGELPEKPIVLSFDDGYESQYLHAVPVLRQLGWPGVLNLKLDTLSDGEMTDKMIRVMLADGWEVDSHTIDHLDVTSLDGENLTYEVAGSRTMLQKRFKIPVNFFCYPAGRYDAKSIAALRRAGYTGAMAEDNGLAAPTDNAFKLRRLRITNDDGVSGMNAKIAGVS